MIDILRSRLDNTHSLEYQRHQVREFLQHIILRILSKGKRFSHIAFVGGTCLRICHQLPRYSEDLDFSLIQPQGYDFLALIKYLQRELVLYNFTISIKYKRGTIDACTIRFGKLLYNL